MNAPLQALPLSSESQGLQINKPSVVAQSDIGKAFLVPLAPSTLARQQLPDSTSAQDEFTIGRSDACKLKLTDIRVSNVHCLIKLHAGTYVLLDNSSNGTFLNGKEVGKGNKTELKDGDRVHILIVHPDTDIQPQEQIGFIFQQILPQKKPMIPVPVAKQTAPQITSLIEKLALEHECVICLELMH